MGRPANRGALASAAEPPEVFKPGEGPRNRGHSKLGARDGISCHAGRRLRLFEGELCAAAFRAACGRTGARHATGTCARKLIKPGSLLLPKPSPRLSASDRVPDIYT